MVIAIDRATLWYIASGSRWYSAPRNALDRLNDLTESKSKAMLAMQDERSDVEASRRGVQPEMPWTRFRLSDRCHAQT